MNLSGITESLEAIPSNIGTILEVAKVGVERQVNAENFMNCIGAVAIISSGAHVLEKNYVRAGVWGAFGMLYLQPRPASQR